MKTKIEFGAALSELYANYGTQPVLADLMLPGVRHVRGEGAQRPVAIFVGEAPGKRENVLARPFIGPSGRTLDKALEANGIKRDKCWVTNAVKMMPVSGATRVDNCSSGQYGTRTPDYDELIVSGTYLWREILLLCEEGPQWPELASPIIVTLGRSALTALTHNAYEGRTLADLHGRRLTLQNSTSSGAHRFHVIPTYHPSGLRSIATKRAFRDDFATIADDIVSRAEKGAYRYGK